MLRLQLLIPFVVMSISLSAQQKIIQTTTSFLFTSNSSEYELSGELMTGIVQDFGFGISLELPNGELFIVPSVGVSALNNESEIVMTDIQCLPLGTQSFGSEINVLTSLESLYKLNINQFHLALGVKPVYTVLSKRFLDNEIVNGPDDNSILFDNQYLRRFNLNIPLEFGYGAKDWQLFVRYERGLLNRLATSGSSLRQWNNLLSFGVRTDLN